MGSMAMRRYSKVLVVLFGLVIFAAGSLAFSQELPTFAAADNGGMPSNLREVAPQTHAPVGDVYPEGEYIIWTAKKIPSVPPQQWKWEKTKICDFKGGKRYEAQIGYGGGLIVQEFMDLRYEKPQPNEFVLQFFSNGRTYWMAFVLEPTAPPSGEDIPSTLREVAPQTNAPIGDVYPAGRYIFWTAKKLFNIPPRQWKWEKTKICDFLGGKRYEANIGYGGGLIVKEFMDLRYGPTQPGEFVLQFFDNGRTYWMAFYLSPIGGSNKKKGFDEAQKIHMVETCGQHRWDGVWVRRGNSNLFDAVWDTYDGGVLKDKGGLKDVIEFKGFQNGQAVFHRTNKGGDYFGRVSADLRHISQGSASWYPGSCSWTGEVELKGDAQPAALEPVSGQSGSGYLVIKPEYGNGQSLMNLRYSISGAAITGSKDDRDTVNGMSCSRALTGFISAGTLRVSGTAHHNPADNWRASLEIKITKHDAGGRTVVKEYNASRPTGGDLPFDVSVPVESGASYELSIHHVGYYNYNHSIDITASFGPRK